MIHIFGGGTVNYVRSHLALSAPAYGTTARALNALLDGMGQSCELQLTRMACNASTMETNADVAERLEDVLAARETRAIVFNVALCDYVGEIGNVPSGKYAQRLQSRDGRQFLQLMPSEKLLTRVKALRPDVFLVGFKTTTGAHPDEQVTMALRQLYEASADVVLANDTGTRLNIFVASAAAKIVTTDRTDVLKRLAHYINQRLA
jgi:hypothetical protein